MLPTSKASKVHSIFRCRSVSSGLKDDGIPSKGDEPAKALARNYSGNHEFSDLLNGRGEIIVRGASYC